MNNSKLLTTLILRISVLLFVFGLSLSESFLTGTAVAEQPTLAATPNCSSESPCWVPKEPMPTGRRDLGVASDSNGRIYAVGGYDGNYYTKLEVYDPLTNNWETKTPAPVARSSMGFTFNPADGKFYFGGGYNEGLYSDFYEYDTGADTWTQKAPLPAPSIGGRFAAANGKIYAIGGSNFSSVHHVFEYDPTLNQWVTKSAMLHPRSYLGLITAPNGKIYAIGGEDSTGDVGYVDEYDPINDTWVAKSPLPTHRSDLGVSLTESGKIVAVGGRSPVSGEPYSKAVEEYDPATNIWTTRTSLPFGIYAPGLALGGDGNVHILGGLIVNEADVHTHFAYTYTVPAQNCSNQNPCWSLSRYMPTPRRDMGVAADGNGKIYVAGGYALNSINNQQQNFTTAFETYDPSTGIWATKASIPVARNDMGFTFNPSNGKFYFGGGYNEGVYNQFYEYDPSTDSWTQKASLPNARLGLRFAAANGKIYAIGGGFLDGSSVTKVEEFDPATNQWAIKSVIPHPRHDLGLVTAVNGKIYAVGGRDAIGSVGYVDEYNPATDSWTAKSSMPTPRHGSGFTVNNNGNILIVNGIDSNGIKTDIVEEYNPSTDTWTTKTPFPFAGYALGMALGNDGNIYAMGGWTVNGPVNNTNYVGSINQPLNRPPTVDAGGPYSVVEGGSTTVMASGSDPDGDPLTYAWDLDNNGSFETPGQSVTFSAAEFDAPSSHSIRVQATDGDLSDTDSATVNIIYNFTGFFQPVDNPPTYNEMPAGRQVKLKFSLSGDQGMNIIATNYPQSQRITCDSGAPIDPVEETTTGSSGLHYDAVADQYFYAWQTNRAWAGTCRQFVMRLNDGTDHKANFKFR